MLLVILWSMLLCWLGGIMSVWSCIERKVEFMMCVMGSDVCCCVVVVVV